MTKQLNMQYIERNNIVAVLLGALIFVWIIFSIAFPVFRINNKMKDDFSLRTINEKQYLELKIKGGYSFHKILIKINQQSSVNESGVLLGKIYQDELGLYTSGDQISNNEQLDKFLTVENSESDIKNGELIKKGDFVYFVSNGTYRAFANAETFDALGFDWKKVQDNKSELLSNLTKGNVIDKSISYLPSSFIEINKEIYLLGLEKRYLINNKDLEKYIRDRFSIILVNDKKLQALGNIKCQQGLRGKKVCEFKDDLKMTLPQSTVFIQMEGKIPVKWSSKIYTFDGFRSLVPRKTLSNIKRNLILRYDQRLGIGNRVNN